MSNSPCPPSPVPLANLEHSFALMIKDSLAFLRTYGMARSDHLTTLLKIPVRFPSKMPGLTSLELRLLCGCRIIFRPRYSVRELEAELFLCTESKRGISQRILVRAVRPADYDRTAGQLTEDLVHISKLCGTLGTTQMLIHGEKIGISTLKHRASSPPAATPATLPASKRTSTSSR